MGGDNLGWSSSVFVSCHSSSMSTICSYYSAPIVNDSSSSNAYTYKTSPKDGSREFLGSKGDSATIMNYYTRLKLRSTVGKLQHVSPYPGTDNFSGHHPMVPKRYVPPWQLDMKNRARTLEIAQRQGLKTWGGHISYFLESRERLNATSYGRYECLDEELRKRYPLHSHISRYNSTILRHERQ